MAIVLYRKLHFLQNYNGHFPSEMQLELLASNTRWLKSQSHLYLRCTDQTIALSGCVTWNQRGYESSLQHKGHQQSHCLWCSIVSPPQITEQLAHLLCM